MKLLHFKINIKVFGRRNHWLQCRNWSMG